MGVQTQTTDTYLAINLPEDDLAQDISWETVGENTLVSSISCTYKGRLVSNPLAWVNGVTYTKTFTNNGSQITNDPQWVPS